MNKNQRRRAMILGYWNGALWAAGNSLVSGPLLYYLADDLKAPGKQIGFLRALPALVGLLRFLAPLWIRWTGGVKRGCVAAFVLAYGIVIGLPVVGWLPQWVSDEHGQAIALTILLGVLIGFHLAESLATVALWSWLGELIPRPIRGRYFAKRQFWQLFITIPVSIGGGYFADEWKAAHAGSPSELLLGYSLANGLGVVLLLLSVIPLLKMPGVSLPPGHPSKDSQRGTWRDYLGVFANRPFLKFLAFRLWFSAANGISQSIQYKYPKDVLKLSAGDLSIMGNVLSAGQAVASRTVGRVLDRHGAKRLLIVCQLLVAAALGFYLLAAATWSWMLLGAYLFWIAYVGHNIAFPTLNLKLSTPSERPAYIATSDALSAAMHAATTIAGGFLFDWLKENNHPNPFAVLIVLGLVGRFLAVPLILLIEEPRQ